MARTRKLSKAYCLLIMSLNKLLLYLGAMLILCVSGIKCVEAEDDKDLYDSLKRNNVAYHRRKYSAQLKTKKRSTWRTTSNKEMEMQEQQEREGLIETVQRFMTTLEGNVTCFPIVGCFPPSALPPGLDPSLIKGTIHGVTHLWPESPREMGLTFYILYGTKFKNSFALGYNPTLRDLQDSPFDAEKESKFFIHGWRDSYQDEGEGIRNSILRWGSSDCNFFIVDWSRASKNLNYPQAASNSRVAGAAVANFLRKLIKYTGMRLESVHLIGHSLGAHVSGFAGKLFNISRPLGRITGLDPAGPCFESENPLNRLDSGDAAYVDIVHSNYGDIVFDGFGLKDDIGDVNFHPNGGQRQPGCEYLQYLTTKRDPLTGIAGALGCNHIRSAFLMASDVNGLEKNCQFVGYQCENYASFTRGNCADCGADNRRCAPLSLWDYIPTTGEAGRKFYIVTSSERYDYCLNHYQVVVHFKKYADPISGTFTMSLPGQNGTKQVKTEKGFSVADSLRLLITTKHKLGRVGQLIVVFENDAFSEDLELIVETIDINFMSHINPKYEMVTPEYVSVRLWFTFVEKENPSPKFCVHEDRAQ